MTVLQRDHPELNLHAVSLAQDNNGIAKSDGLAAW